MVAEMKCDAIIFKEKLDAGNARNRDIIVIEVYVRAGCPHFTDCVKSLNAYLIKNYQYQKSIEDPTTGEQNNRAQGKKERQSRFRRFWSSRF
jgi:hypothetical protein